jgi:hypothetical protein
VDIRTGGNIPSESGNNGFGYAVLTDVGDESVDVFRHKIVHLAQLKLIINRNARKIAWRYEYPETSNHLKIVYTGTKKIEILAPYDMYYDHVFVISITQLMYDIVDSVIRFPDGYFANLKKGHKNMLKNFADAIEQIYNPDK